MDTSREGIELQVIVIAMIVVILLSVGVIVFFMVYQRRLLGQHRAQQKMKSDYQVDLLKTSITSQEDERSRISKDLHDNIGAMLTTTKIYFEHVSTDLSKEELRELKQKMNGLLESMIDSTRRISKNLSPIVLVKLGLIEAIKSLLEVVNETGRVVSVIEAPSSVDLNQSSALNVYRIIQELTTNSLKHTKSDELLVRIRSLEEKIEITYEDNGGGFDPSEINAKKGIGLKNIESRVSVLNGTMEYRSSTKGMNVIFLIPKNGGELAEV